MNTRMTIGIVLCAAAAFATDHKSFKTMPIADCQQCHRGEGVAENHGPGFRKEHRLLALKAETNCNQCHEQSSCDECHRQGNVETIHKGLSRRGEPMPHETTYLAVHAIDARSNPRTCERCHQSETFCSDCHTQSLKQSQQRNGPGMDIRPHAPVYAAPGVPDPAWVQFHASDARRNLQTCQGCHPNKTDCSNFQCHPGLGGR